MIRDITIGQYFPGRSAIHRMDPRVKILLSVLYIVMLFVAGNLWGLLLGVLFGAVSLAGAQLPELLTYAGSVFWMLACAQQMLKK